MAEPVALWMIVINPLTKFGQCSRPVRSLFHGHGVVFCSAAPLPSPSFNHFPDHLAQRDNRKHL